MNGDTIHNSAPHTTARRIAIVTGSAAGIGAGIALRLAKDGFAVVISDLESQHSRMEEMSQKCAKVAALVEGEEVKDVFPCIACDVSKESNVVNLVNETVRIFNRLDCMVANAGIGKFEALSDVPLETFNKIMQVNATGTLLCYREAAKAMIKCNTATGGRIIGGCSLAGKKGVPFFGSYCASKFAIRGLTQTAALEYGSAGITVNAYAPGFIETALIDQVRDNLKKAMGEGGNAFIEAVAGSSALGRTGTVEEIANLVSFLASDQSSFITGQCISIDGGCNFD